MDRQFFPFGGFGFRPFFRPFRHPFFPRRFLFPFFAISPFFPFFRGESDRNDMCFAQHQTKEGDTLENIAHAYNIPYPILEEANPHVGDPTVLRPNEIVYIPRISNVYCHKTYIERDMPYTGVPAPAYYGQQMMPYTEMPSTMYPGNMMPYTGTPSQM